MKGEVDELLLQVAALIRTGQGWPLRPVRRLGRPREDRHVWLGG